MQLIAAGKHVFCEKPLAESYPHAREMAEAAEAAGVVNMVNLTYRNAAALQTARTMIAARRDRRGPPRRGLLPAELARRQPLGRLAHRGANWLWRLSEQHGSKGVLGDVGVHILDFACHAVGIDIVALAGADARPSTRRPGDRIDDYPLDVNDSVMMTVEFPNGALGVIHTSRYMTGYGNVLKLHVFGTEGAIEIDHGLDWTEIRACLGPDVHTLAWRRIVAEPVATLHHHFVSAIVEGKRDADPSFRRGAEIQRILDCASNQTATQAAALR